MENEQMNKKKNRVVVDDVRDMVTRRACEPWYEQLARKATKM